MARRGEVFALTLQSICDREPLDGYDSKISYLSYSSSSSSFDIPRETGKTRILDSQAVLGHIAHEVRATTSLRRH